MGGCGSKVSTQQVSTQRASAKQGAASQTSEKSVQTDLSLLNTDDPEIEEKSGTIFEITPSQTPSPYISSSSKRQYEHSYPRSLRLPSQIHFKISPEMTKGTIWENTEESVVV